MLLSAAVLRLAPISILAVLAIVTVVTSYGAQ